MVPVQEGKRLAPVSPTFRPPPPSTYVLIYLTYGLLRLPCPAAKVPALRTNMICEVRPDTIPKLRAAYRYVSGRQALTLRFDVICEARPGAGQQKISKKKKEKELITARRCLARAEPERGFLLTRVFLPIAQLLLLRRSLWPGSLARPRLPALSAAVPASDRAGKEKKFRLINSKCRADLHYCLSVNS